MNNVNNLKYWIVYSYLDKYNELDLMIRNYMNKNIKNIFEKLDVNPEQLYFNLGANYAYKNQQFVVDLSNHKISSVNNSKKTPISKFIKNTNLTQIDGSLLKGYNIIDNVNLLIDAGIIDDNFNEIPKKNVSITILTKDLIQNINKVRNRLAHHLHDINVIEEAKTITILSDELLSRYIIEKLDDKTSSIYFPSEDQIQKVVEKLDDNYKIILTLYFYMLEFISNYKGKLII